MLDYYKKALLRRLQSNDYAPVKLNRVAQDLGIAADRVAAFKEAFEDLRRAGQVVYGPGNTVKLPPPGSQIIGTYRANASGFGFVSPRIPNDQGDLYISAGKTGDAMTGDLVLAEVSKGRSHESQEKLRGRIVDILERGLHRVVGTLVQQAGRWRVQPEGSGFLDPIEVEDVSAKSARAKDKVVVEILSYPTDRYLARGAITEVLGRTGHYETEILSAIHRFHLCHEFSETCLNEGRRIVAAFQPEQASGREDLRQETVITIDPPDAKDFDDAISLTQNQHGHWVLGVHIADASHFVAPGSELDREAALRGNSVYLPGRTLPMLPEVLSNGICSLQPDQERFTKSAFITYNDRGEVLQRRFANTWIRSSCRLTYLQADAVLNGRTQGLNSAVRQLLKRMETLSRVIEMRRNRAGMIHLDLPETDLETDASGLVVGAHPAENSYPHTMIEMFMVEANDAVAALLDRHHLPFIRRIHPDPEPSTLKKLSKLVKIFGYNLGRQPDRFALQDLLQAVQGQDCSLAVNIAVLRSLAKAEYSPLHMGHYALASPCYSHFTSPIRRYADLMVHRQMQYVLDNRIDLARQTAAAEDLKAIGQHLSHTEKAAEEAEQDLKRVLILQHLTQRLGDDIVGVVTGLTRFGVFVNCPPYGIEGMIRLSDLGDDYWDYQERFHCVVGSRTGAVLSLGQRLKVRIAAVNVAGRHLDLVPAQSLIPETGRAKTRRSKGPTGDRRSSRRRSTRGRRR